MAGRILPVALAVVSGIAISIATFGEEFKEQQRRRLQAEYERDINAVSALPSAGPSPMASSKIPSPHPEQLPAQTQTAKTTETSSTFGLWAWSSRHRTEHVAKDQVPVEEPDATPNHKP